MFCCWDFYFLFLDGIFLMGSNLFEQGKFQQVQWAKNFEKQQLSPWISNSDTKLRIKHKKGLT